MDGGEESYGCDRDVFGDYLLLVPEDDPGGYHWPNDHNRKVPKKQHNKRYALLLPPEGAELLFRWNDTITGTDGLLSAAFADWLTEFRSTAVSQPDWPNWASASYDAVILFLTNRANGLLGSNLEDQDQNRKELSCS